MVLTWLSVASRAAAEERADRSIEVEALVGASGVITRSPEGATGASATFAAAAGARALLAFSTGATGWGSFGLAFEHDFRRNASLGPEPTAPNQTGGTSVPTSEAPPTVSSDVVLAEVGYGAGPADVVRPRAFFGLGVAITRTDCRQGCLNSGSRTSIAYEAGVAFPVAIGPVIVGGDLRIVGNGADGTVLPSARALAGVSF